MIKADLHCHTLASVHAYSTVFEMITFAKARGLSVVAITDHGPMLSDSSKIWHFKNMNALPLEYDGVRILKGVEANIINKEGDIDLPDDVLDRLDWVIASFHDEPYLETDAKENTKTWIKVVKDPRINMLGHPDRHPFAFEIEPVVRICREYSKVVEINNHSFTMARGNVPEIIELARLCKKYNVYVAVNSDAHSCFEIGDVGFALDLLKELNYDRDLIISYNPELIMELVKGRKKTR